MGIVEYQKNSNLKKYFILLVSIVYLISLVFPLFFNYDLKCLVALNLFFALSNIILTRKNIYVFILFFFILMYQIPPLLYFFYDVQISPFLDFNEYNIYKDTFLINSLFNYSLFIGILFLNEIREKFIIKYPSFPSGFIYFIMLLICFCLIIFGQSGQNIFEANGYASGLSDKSTFYEYFILFFAIANFFSTRKGLQFYLLQIAYFVYVVKSLLYGGRVEVLQVTLLNFYILLGDSRIKISNNFIFALLIVGYYISSIFSNIRNDPSIVINFDFAKIFSPFSINSDTLSYSSNEGEVFQSSARLIGLIELGYLDFFARVKSALGFFLSIFLPSSSLPVEASLITFMKEEFNSGGGGLISIYFYCWFSYLGPIIIAFFVLFLIRKVKTSTNNIFKSYLFLAFSTFPRWFAYNPIILFKLCFWIIPILFLFKILSRKNKLI